MATSSVQQHKPPPELALKDVHVKNFIGGAYQEPIKGEYLPMINPATGETFGKIPDSTSDDIDKAFQVADAAFPAWSALTSQARSTLLLKLAATIESRLHLFAFAESIDCGKPLNLSLSLEIPRAIYNFRFFASAILHSEDISTHMEGAFNYTTQCPLGVVGLISPWNLPLYLLTWKIAPAIAVGNTCIAKPSELTSYTAYLLCQAIKDSGIPDGVVNIVFGRGATAGNALVEHPGVRLISFTGGTLTAEKIIVNSAKSFKKLSLELGGKNPNIIFDDADLSLAVKTSVSSSFQNSGQICLCGSRIFVHEKIYDEFLTQFVQLCSQIKIGDPLDMSTIMGSLISEDHMKKVKSYITLAQEEGGKIELGGLSRPEISDETLKNGYFVAPTIITGLKHKGRVQQEEIFGPVVVVTKFSTEKEAIEMANSTNYGLSASVWTENGKRGARVAKELRVGTVWVNCWMKRDLRVPFGGVKWSGYGREGGKYSLDMYTEHKNICMATL